MIAGLFLLFFFFFNDTATTEIYTLSLHDALPIHVYDTATSRPVAVLLRPGKTPSGTEIRGHLHRLVRRLRRHWPQTRITIRGDGHYGRPQVMEWCDENDIDFVFGL